MTPGSCRISGGIPTIVLGPGKPGQAHSINESIPVEDYLTAIYIYANLLVKWCGVEELG